MNDWATHKYKRDIPHTHLLRFSCHHPVCIFVRVYVRERDYGSTKQPNVSYSLATRKKPHTYIYTHTQDDIWRVVHSEACIYMHTIKEGHTHHGVYAVQMLDRK